MSGPQREERDWENLSLVEQAMLACNSTPNRTDKELYRACNAYLKRHGATAEDYKKLDRKFSQRGVDTLSGSFARGAKLSPTVSQLLG